MSTVALLLMGVLAGCSDSDPATAPASGGSSTTTSWPTADRRPPPSTVDEALSLGRPVILAHAGGDTAHPHSVPYGYAASVAGGVDVLDFDVQLSADGVLVIQHDETVERTTEGSGRVAELTFDELHALDNAYWFTATCTCRDQPESAYVLRGVRTGEKPPPEGSSPDDFAIARFEDVAAGYPGYVVNVEIKGKYPDSVPAAKELARILKKLGRERSAVVTAFDDQLAEAFHAELPEVAITPGLSASTSYVLDGVVPQAGRRILQVPPDYVGQPVLTPDLVTRSKADGLVLWIWPNEDKWENADGYRQLLDMGVGGIDAADPIVAVEALRAWLPG